MKYDIFISYRRDGGEYTARILRDKLTELGYNVFFDVESLRSGDFNAALYDVIEGCNDFVLVLSPNSLDRCVNEGDWVRNEIEHAIKSQKNIVPILMRGFDFPEKLPESIASLPKYNGIEANSQFFDAFIAKLQEFLISRPTVIQRITQNPLYKKSLPLIIAFVVVLGAFSGFKNLWESANAVYPRTATEKNIADRVVLSVMDSMTNINITADYSYQLLDRAENYIIAAENNFGAFRSDYENLSAGISENTDKLQPVNEQLTDKLYETPFSPADVVSLNEQAAVFSEEWLGKIKYIKYVVSDDCYLSPSEKLQVIRYYRNILDASLAFYSDCYANGILVPVTSEEYLINSYFLENMAYLQHIPYEWCNDEDILYNRINSSLNEIETAVQKFSAIVGNENMENAQLNQNMVQYYMLLGYSKDEAIGKVAEYQQKVDSIIAGTEEIRQICLPQDDDDAYILWYKMSHLLAINCFDDARECLKAFQKVSADDIYAEQYILASKNLIDCMEDNGTIYGVMVTGFEKDAHPVLKAGDLIISFNGDDCFWFEKYTEYKQALTTDSYTLTVIRFDENNNPVLQEIHMTTDMPLISLSTLVYHDDML